MDPATDKTDEPFGIRKRTASETQAYWEGFFNGLRAAQSAIGASLDRYELLRRQVGTGIATPPSNN
jgi:hypothetical protein